MSINEVRWLSECGSTNAYAKEHFEEFGPVGAVYTTNQTAGRGRLGRSWVNAEGRALYYTAVIREPLAQPATLPLLASLAVRDQLAQRYGVQFLYRDFRPYFRAGQEFAREHGFYMQKYCGCIFSEEERYMKPKKILP